MEIKKGYYAVIPASVRYDKSLPMGARMLYGEITALCNQEGFCWANNSYFAELYETSDKTIQRWISALVDNCYIVRNIQFGADGKTVLRRCLAIAIDNDPRYRQNCPEGADKNVPNPTDKNVLYNNTSINTTINNKVSKKESSETFDSLIEKYTQDKELTESLIEFVKMRKLIKKPMTNRALELIFERLDKLAKLNNDKVLILDKSILNCWQDIFALKQDGANKQQSDTSQSVYERIDNLE